MTIFLTIIVVFLLGLFLTWLLKCKHLEKRVKEQEIEITAAKQEVQRIQSQSQQALASAQALIDQEMSALRQESDRHKAHYENEARRIHAEAAVSLEQAQKTIVELARYQKLKDAEAEVQGLLAEATKEASELRQEATQLLERARAAAAEERSRASQKSKELFEQAEARLRQAILEAGQIDAAAHKRAEDIVGKAYLALREKERLEQAVRAMENVVQGYGDRYLIPPRSLLDDLATEFGHTAAGEALRAARELGRHLVEQGQAAACDYVESGRRETAIRFVVDAFNGRVDAILSRVKHDNYGTLAQEIRDAFGLVNIHGAAFRDARVLPSYLDARLAELKWATIVQELRLKEREEQQRIKEQMREEEKARREYERAMREAAKEEEILRKAMETAQLHVQQATAEQRKKYEEELQALAIKLKEAEERNQRAISMAQQTRRGHVYIISNIGSFGDHVYKIGLTRRLEPKDRIDELGDSSVPFDFDVHALIFSEDAPALETQLHKHFLESQVNKVNHRKEFFRVDLKHVREEIQKLGIEAKWTMTAKAAEYHQTLAIEKAIAADPANREAWIKRQLELDPVDGEMGIPLDIPLGIGATLPFRSPERQTTPDSPLSDTADTQEQVRQ